MTLYKWSQTASVNGTVDSTCLFPEGMSPAAVNDGTRGMMAAVAKWRDDISGAGLATGGTPTAYTLVSNQAFDSTAHMAAQTLTVYPHVTNGASPTLNVDALGAFPIVQDGAGTPVAAGTMIAGSPYEVAFQNSSSRWILKSFFVKPYEMPLAASMEYWGPTLPNNSFAWLNGQAISRTTYAALFALIGTTYGAGDGTTTFNLPDKRGRVSAGKGDMGGAADANLLNGTYFGSGTTLGAAGGAQAHTLTLAELPAGITSGGVNAISVSSASNNVVSGNLGNTTAGNAGAITVFNPGQATSGTLASSGNNTIAVTSNNTGGGAHPTVQPTIICNFIMRII